MGDHESEWGFAVFGMSCCALLVAAIIAGWQVYERVHHEPSRLNLTIRCLTRERGLTIDRGESDALAAGASAGWLATVVEGNGVHIAIAGSAREAARIAASYAVVADLRAGQLEQRGSHVYLWAEPSSPTQRQTVYDCEY
jgi:hypothetical protein